MSKQREDWQEWEKKLQEVEGRLENRRRLLNQREERANELDNTLKEKQNDLVELRKKSETTNSTLRTKEDDISSRLPNLALIREEAEDILKRLEDEEKILFEWEEKLNAGEGIDVQKLLDDHKSILAAKQKEFEMEQKRQLNDEQLKNKVVEVENKEPEIKHMEEKVKKREQAIEKKMEKVREREMDFDSKSNALKEREKSLKVEEKNLEKELAEKEELLSIKAALENINFDTEKMRVKINEDREQLKITEDERREHAHLQLELKEEMDKYRFQSEQLIKEADDLKQEKGKFEKEWEELDEKREKIRQEQENVHEEKICFEKLRQYEEERLHNEKLETERELEALKLAKDSFAASMEHEKSMLAEKLENEKSKLTHDYEMQRQEFEAKMRQSINNLLAVLKILDDLPLPIVADAYLKKAAGAESSPVPANSGSPNAAGTVSWHELDYAQGPQGPVNKTGGEVEPHPSSQVANDSVDVEIVDSENGIREVETPSIDQDPLPGKREGHSERITDGDRTKKRRRVMSWFRLWE